MWAVQDLSRLLHCLAGWACRTFNLGCLHVAIRLGGGDGDGGGPPGQDGAAAGGGDGGGKRAVTAGGSGGGAPSPHTAAAAAAAAPPLPSVVVAVSGISGQQRAEQALAFFNKELNDVLVA